MSVYIDPAEIKKAGYSSLQDFFQCICAYAGSFKYSFISPGSPTPEIPYGSFRRIVAWSKCKNTECSLEVFLKKDGKWKFGYLAYDLKSNLHRLHSSSDDKIPFPLVDFFYAEHVLEFDETGIWLHQSEHTITQLISELRGLKTDYSLLACQSIQCSSSYSEYLEAIEKVKELIRCGEVYELNYCITYHIEGIKGSGIGTFLKLIGEEVFPFAAFYKSENFEILSFSPERFLKKNSHLLISQPIKGTAPRFDDPHQDEMSKISLRTSEKEIAENMMITDLVRNDLAKICEVGTVKVDELFGVYSYPGVHQLISTVSGFVKEGVNEIQIMQSLFPMGSMTGAPKLRAMQYIDELEKHARGAYSGALGYVDASADFDFNVLIRTLFIDTSLASGKYCVGSAITIDSDAFAEWKECQLKARMLFKIFQ